MITKLDLIAASMAAINDERHAECSENKLNDCYDDVVVDETYIKECQQEARDARFKSNESHKALVKMIGKLPIPEERGPSDDPKETETKTEPKDIKFEIREMAQELRELRDKNPCGEERGLSDDPKDCTCGYFDSVIDDLEELANQDFVQGTDRRVELNWIKD